MVVEGSAPFAQPRYGFGDSEDGLTDSRCVFLNSCARKVISVRVDRSNSFRRASVSYEGPAGVVVLPQILGETVLETHHVRKENIEYSIGKRRIRQQESDSDEENIAGYKGNGITFIVMPLPFTRVVEVWAGMSHLDLRNSLNFQIRLLSIC